MEKGEKTLQDALHDKHITQVSLGRELGLSESQISLLVKGRRRMNLEVAAHIAKRLDVSINTVYALLQAARAKGKTDGYT